MGQTEKDLLEAIERMTEEEWQKLRSDMKGDDAIMGAAGCYRRAERLGVIWAINSQDSCIFPIRWPRAFVNAMK